MKRANRFICVLLALLLCVLAVPASALQYSDVEENNWFYPYVSDLSEKGIISGYPDGTFKPGNEVTLGEALKLILLAANCGEQAPQNNHWAGGYLQYALSKKFLTGKTVADLDKSVDRLTIVRTAAKALDAQESKAETPFTDVDDALLTALYEKGIITGSIDLGGNRVFEPQSGIVRSELSAIIYRMNTIDIHEGQIKYGDYWVDILDELPKNPYDPDLFVKQNGVMTYADKSVETHLGIDVSTYQGDIDWAQVAASGVEFVFVRVGYRGYGKSGSMNEDKNYRKNIEGAKAAGLKVGVYFFSQAISMIEAVEEAKYVLSLIDGYELEYPVVFDWEIIGSATARTDNVSTDMLCSAANSFCKTVESAGYTPMVYFNKHVGYMKYDLNKIMQYDVWFAQYADKPDFYYDFDIWQYTSKGSVPGIKGDVDMNIGFKDYSAK